MAVSEEFANRFPSLLCKWDGKTVALADGMQVPSHRGLRVKIKLQNKDKRNCPSNAITRNTTHYRQQLAETVR